MNELKALWGEIKNDDELELITSNKIQHWIRQSSSLTNEKLIQKINLRFWWAIAMAALLIPLIVFTAQVIIQSFLFMLFTGHLIGGILLFQEKINLKNELNLEDNLLLSLKNARSCMIKVKKYEALVSLFFYPITAVSGFLLGMFLYDHQTELLNSPEDWLYLLVAISILVPMSYLLNNKWNKASFDALIDQTNEHINELENGS